jgi:hypothetical protein
MNSRVGPYSGSVDLYNIIKDSSYASYSCATIAPDKLADGSECETVVVQAAPFIDSTSIELLGDIIFEVAINADYLEGKYFGGDNN